MHHGFIEWIRDPKVPTCPSHVRLLVQFGGFKIFLGQIIGQTELQIPLILGSGINKDLVVSRVRAEVTGFPIPLRDCHFIGPELLLLGVGNDDGSKAWLATISTLVSTRQR